MFLPTPKKKKKKKERESFGKKKSILKGNRNPKNNDTFVFKKFFLSAFKNVFLQILFQKYF